MASSHGSQVLQAAEQVLSSSSMCGVASIVAAAAVVVMTASAVAVEKARGLTTLAGRCAFFSASITTAVQQRQRFSAILPSTMMCLLNICTNTHDKASHVSCLYIYSYTYVFMCTTHVYVHEKKSTYGSMGWYTAPCMGWFVMAHNPNQYLCLHPFIVALLCNTLCVVQSQLRDFVVQVLMAGSASGSCRL